MVELIDKNGFLWRVNPHNVCRYCQEPGKNTKVYFVDGSSIEVTQTYAQVTAMMCPAPQPLPAL